MCGIVGILGREQVADHIIDALRRLEYRGYDSAGIATLETASSRGGAPKASSKISKDGLSVNLSPGPAESDTRAGPRMAVQRRTTRIRTRPTDWLSYTTASSKIFVNCARSCNPKARILEVRPIPRW